MTQFAPVLLTEEEFAQREPLTARLHGLVRSYPKGVGLVQEFLQNADDAGAQSLSVFLDNRTYPSQRLPAPLMSELQGPALVVTNDARFSPDDWNNIQQIGESGKALDATKTGRFGLGFNCVYNVTDFPTLLTGQRIGIFDPHGHAVDSASRGRTGSAWRLDVALWSHCPDLLVPFEDFGLSRDAVDYPGTAFRLPLRTRDQAAKSKICQQPFTLEDFDSIVEKLRDHLGDLLLFLRNVQDIDLWLIDAAGNRRLALSAHTVNRQAVEESRKRIRQALETKHELLLNTLANPNAAPIVSEYNHEVEFTDTDGRKSQLTYHVVNGLFRDSAGKVTDCARQMLLLDEKAVPLAGAAIRLDALSLPEFQGRVFCSLPLPLTSPLGFCHVNGFFDLQADRQGLFQDPGAGGTGAIRVNWNRLLLEHCCSEAAARLCANLSRTAQFGVESIYEHWPRIPRQEQSILDSLPRHVYGRLRSHKCIAAGGDPKWLLPKEVMEFSSKASAELRSALLSDTFPLPNPMLPGFVTEGFAKSGQGLTAISPATLRAQLRVSTDINCELPTAPRPCLRNSTWVNALLQFCASDGRLDDLLGVPLAYMASGKLRAFGRNLRDPIFLAGPEERTIFAKMSHWFIDSSQEELGILQDSKPVGTLRLTPQRTVANLENALPRPGPEGWISVKSETENIPSEDWLCRVFEYMNSHAPGLKLDGDSVQKLPLVPDQFGALHIMGTANTPLLPSTEDSKTLLTAISEFGVPLVSGSEKLLKAVRAFIETFPNLGVWRLSPGDLIDTLSAISLKQPPLSGTQSGRNNTAVLDYIATPRGVRDVKGQNVDRTDRLRKLRLFPTSSGRLVSLNTDDHHIAEAYEMPGFTTELGILDTGKDQRWLPLYQVLGVPTLTRFRLVTKVLLPRMEDLSDGDRQGVLLWLRSNLHRIREEESAESGAALVLQLGSSLPIRCNDGRLRPPRLLYHPDSTSVTALLGNDVGFPDSSVYRNRTDLWLEFFEALGMARTPRSSDIVSAIDGIIAMHVPGEEKADHISQIAEYIEKHWDELKAQTISDGGSSTTGSLPLRLIDALSNREWLPAITDAPRDYPGQLLANKTSIFFKPAELLQRTSLSIAGSVRPICRIFRLSQLQADIGLRAEPELEDVLTHFENVLSVIVPIDGPLDDRFVTIFKRVYMFLGRHFAEEQAYTLEADPRVVGIRRRFARKRCLVDSDRQTWLPEHCFADPITGFLGRRARVRAEAEDFDRGLRVLGRRDRPEASDYVAFFKELTAAQAGAPIPQFDRILLRSAYLAAATLDDGHSFRGCPVLLESGVLQNAAMAVVDDAPWLSERARKAQMQFLDPELVESVAVAFDARLLSSAVYESPQTEEPSRSPSFLSECAELETRLRSSQMCAGVNRLLKSSDSAVRIDALRRFLSELRVIPVSQLSTVLFWTDGDIQVEGSNGSCDVMFDHPRNAIVVSEDAYEVLYELVGSTLSNELRLDGHDLGDSTTHLVAILRVPPEAMDRHLNKLHVRTLPETLVEVPESDSDDREGFIDAPDEVVGHETPISADSSKPFVPTEPEKLERDAFPSLIQEDAISETQRKGRDEDRSDRQRQSPSSIQADTGAAGPSSNGSEGTSDSSDPSHRSLPSEAGIPGYSGRSGGGEHPRQQHGATAEPPMKPAISSFPFPTETPVPHHGKLRSDQTGGQRGRARTYVTPHSDTQREESPEKQQRRQRVDQAAVTRVIQFEKERGRLPKEMPHMNEGYDIESYLPDGHIDRFIEVKGSSGTWSDFGVALSREQFRKASREGNAFWLYVVEFALEPDRSRVYAIQSPAESVDEYWFDGGWRDLAKERGAPVIEAALKVGSAILLDDSRRGTVKDIRKRGVLMLLDIEFEDNRREQVVYSPRRVKVLQSLPEEETQQ